LDDLDSIAQRFHNRLSRQTAQDAAKQIQVVSGIAGTLKSNGGTEQQPT
jgi:hypothetical protein